MKKATQLIVFVSSLLAILAAFFPLTAAVAKEKASKEKEKASSKTLWQPFYIFPRTGDQHLDLSGKWDLLSRDSEVGDPSQITESWQYQVKVPDGIHWSLFEAGALPHPYHHLNSKKYDFVDEKVWYYRKTFRMPRSLKGEFAFLCFDGVDYYSRVWLNGTLLGRHEGMFGGPHIEVSRHLLPPGKDNQLIVEVKAANFGMKKTFNSRSNPRPAIHPMVISRGVGAKDFMTVGIWQGIRLEIVPKEGHLERPFLITKRASADEAELELRLEVICGSHALNAQITERGGFSPINERRGFGRQRRWPPPEVIGGLSVHIELIEKGSGKIAHSKIVPLKIYAGRNWIREQITLTNPKLWWPNGLGAPNLYRIRLALVRNGVTIDELEFPYGVRTIRTLPSAAPQTVDRWGDWQFEVNGRKLFLKGNNWMMADVLLHLPKEKYRWLLETARNAGIQIMRINGSFMFETEEFYRICNELGIMIWQDFPTDWSLRRGDSSGRPQDVWEAQVVMNVFRIRNHPALAYYCGGSGFNPYTFKAAATIGILERSLADFDGTRDFYRSSPDRGAIWGYVSADPTWFQYLFTFAPSIQETGPRSFPDARGLREVVDQSEFEKPLSDISDMSGPFRKEHPELIHHFLAYKPTCPLRMVPRGSQMMDLSAPTLEIIVEATQMGAGEYYQILSDMMQANYPVTTMLMPWAFNRPWPLIGWQIVDSFGHPLAPYYFLKRTYESTHVMVQLPHLMWAKGEKMPITAKVLHATAEALSDVTLKVEILDHEFHQQWEETKTITVEPGPSVTAVDLGTFSIPEAFADKFFFIVAEMSDSSGKLISRSVYHPRCLRMMEDESFRTKYRAKPRAPLTFDKGPWLKEQVAKNETVLGLKIISTERTGKDRSVIRVKVRNTGKKPAFPVTLEINGIKRAFFATDNYFWLAPGEEKEVTINALWREKLDKRKLSLTVEAWNSRLVEVPMSSGVETQ